MSTIKVDVSSSKKPVLQVGYQEENEVTDVLFDISAWVEEYGGGTAGLRVKRPQNSEEESYELSLPISENVATWTVSETDTHNKGNGKVQLKYYVGSALKESAVYTYKVGKSIVGSDNPVDPFDTWIERSKAWATGELLDGEDVPASDETYHNNAKYYAEQSGTQAEEAEAQAVEAKAQADLAKQYAHQFVGAPRAAAAAADMTDHDLIYVFTGTTTSSLTNGHWYYWNGSAWTDGGVYNSTAFTTDTTLAVSGAAADAKVAGDKITDLKEDLDEVVEMHTSTNLLNFNDPDFLENKYINNINGVLYDSSAYNTSGYIHVEVGKTYIFTFGNQVGVAQSIRFLCAFDSSKSAIGSAGGENLRSYTVPEGVAFIRFSSTNDYFNPNALNIMFGESPITEYEEYFAPYINIKNTALDADYLNSLINAKIVDTVTDYGLSITAKADSMSNTDTLTAVQNVDNKTNAVIEFIGYFNEFTSLVMGHGFEISYGNKVVIDNTNMTVYYGSSNQQMSQVAHGLTISDFIHVVITQNNGARAKIQIITSTGDYTLTDCSWDGCRGNVFAKVGNNMTECVLTAIFKNFNEKVFVFGDSYVGLEQSRFPYYLYQNNYNHLYLDGWGGRNSANALISFNNVIEKAIPKYAVWVLGMNDADSATAVNSSWLSCVQEFISKCETNGIIPILCTIPNCPNQRNSYKNAWVKSSGKRYVDFAKAVGAEETGSSWYTGMLSSDNVHPTTLGAKALFARFITDAPEVIR